MAAAKRFVYILNTRSTPSRYYTGVTSNVSARLAAHNAAHERAVAGGRYLLASFQTDQGIHPMVTAGARHHWHVNRVRTPMW
jgi:predicted GIY-YIG superfamily endonuclease